MKRSGPKRKQPPTGDTMINMTIRISVGLLNRLDEEVVRQAHATGMATLNRSDVVRTILARALAGAS
jgi:hypothetical protein